MEILHFLFAEWACDRVTEDFATKIFSNKQSCRIWDTENLHAYIEKPTHPKRVTVWTALRATQPKLHSMFFSRRADNANCRLATLRLRFDTIGLLFVGAVKHNFYADDIFVKPLGKYSCTIDNVIKNWTEAII
ncbi:hypothetical protein EVAR_73936_1 [Eumeta japonica]|uniref:Uncharacterized protein n=1 Tax=Eumeta variegata TaxID=151549 RepID=A0A4C1SRT4_EUMVA|nr:hypothetical protein EVAR_73936_1 [Eumeta japonica]